MTCIYKYNGTVRHPVVSVNRGQLHLYNKPYVMWAGPFCRVKTRLSFARGNDKDNIGMIVRGGRCIDSVALGTGVGEYCGERSRGHAPILGICNFFHKLYHFNSFAAIVRKCVNVRCPPLPHPTNVSYSCGEGVPPIFSGKFSLNWLFPMLLSIKWNIAHCKKFAVNFTV